MSTQDTRTSRLSYADAQTLMDLVMNSRDTARDVSRAGDDAQWRAATAAGDAAFKAAAEFVRSLERES